MGHSESQESSSWSPRSWSRKVWIWVGVGTVVVVAAVVGGVVGARVAKRNSSYPNYSRLNYTLVDTCESAVGIRSCCVGVCVGVSERETRALFRGNGLTRTIDSGTSFFDKFNYFHDYDPSITPLSQTTLSKKLTPYPQPSVSYTTSTQSTRRITQVPSSSNSSLPTSTNNPPEPHLRLPIHRRSSRRHFRRARLRPRRFHRPLLGPPRIQSPVRAGTLPLRRQAHPVRVRDVAGAVAYRVRLSPTPFPFLPLFPSPFQLPNTPTVNS